MALTRRGSARRGPKNNCRRTQRTPVTDIRVFEPYFTVHRIGYNACIPYSLRWITQFLSDDLPDVSFIQYKGTRTHQSYTLEYSIFSSALKYQIIYTCVIRFCAVETWSITSTWFKTPASTEDSTWINIIVYKIRYSKVHPVPVKRIALPNVKI